MSDQYIGEIRYFTYLRGAPDGWLLCDGSTQSINGDYQALGTLLGTTYGGDGQSTFGLPDLRGRVAIGVSSSYPLGSTVGGETVSLNSNQLPPHAHINQASTNGVSSTDPTNRTFGTGANIYFSPTTTPTPVAMAVTATGVTGQGLPHENCAPTLTLLPCIAYVGVYPAPN